MFKISKVMEISTHYITEQTARLLDENPMQTGLTIYPKGAYGWLIHIPSSLDSLEELPEDLRDVLCYAARFGCRWVDMDMDIDTEETDLKRYNW